MNKYVIIHGQLHELSDDELMHWSWKKKDAKYIKREWKNGKWQYTYPDDPKSDYQKKSDAARTYSKQAKSARAKNIANVDNLAPKDRPSETYSTLRKSSREFDLERAAKKAENKYYTTTEGKLDRKVSNTTASVKKAADSAENWIKDKLGYDEKAAMENTKTKATVKKYEYDDVRKKNDEHMKKFYTHDPETGALIKKDGYDYQNEWAEWQNNYYKEMADEAKDEALAAEYKYNKTALAAFEKISGKIDKLAERGKEHVKRGLGYYDKFAYEQAQNELQYAKEEVFKLQTAIKQLPPRDKVISPEYIDYMDNLPKDLARAESRLESAKINLKQQKKDYMETPLKKISENERLYEFVDEWLNGTSKKRKKH